MKHPASRLLLTFVLVLLSAVPLVSCGARANVWRHSPAAAALAAELWARTALLDGNIESAHRELADAFRDATSAEELVDVMNQMHPDGWPESVTATEYEPTLGQKGMNIFLEGQVETQSFYYRFWMSGTADEGYEVAGVFRGSGPYPPSDLREPLN